MVHRKDIWHNRSVRVATQTRQTGGQGNKRLGDEVEHGKGSWKGPAEDFRYLSELAPSQAWAGPCLRMQNHRIP
jgi:hypothetical protein